MRSEPARALLAGAEVARRCRESRSALVRSTRLRTDQRQHQTSANGALSVVSSSGSPPKAATGRRVRDEVSLPTRCGHPGERGDAANVIRARRRSDVFEVVRLVDDHEVMLGEQPALEGEIERQQVLIDDDEIGGRRLVAGLLGEAHGAARAPRRARALTNAHADGRPGGRRRLEVEFGAIAGASVGRPQRDASDLIVRASRPDRLRTCAVWCRELGGAATDVVARPFKTRP